ncbi:hypothetical protein HDU98_011036 [Podochytrium sp. JEL0797]|nr:hypothetical protein HDU98_011036 [Podochytrium sp. JEL0797]
MLSYSQVAELVALSEEDYAAVAPSPPDFEQQIARKFLASPPSLGRQTREALFATTQQGKLVFLAHGSYGRAPSTTLQAKAGWTTAVEANPVSFFYRTLYPHLLRSLRTAAPLLGTAPANTVFTTNVEEAIATVLHSVCGHVSDVGPYRLIAFDFTYGACKLALERIATTQGCTIEYISTTWPITSTSIATDLTNFLQNASSATKPRIHLALFEHITSPTALLLPIQTLITQCRNHNILSLIDGAHGIGQLRLSLDTWQPDFYTTNTHKWLCHARGCALLYIHPSHHTKIHPLVTSWGSAHDSLQSRFIWQGTNDLSSLLSLPTTIQTLEWISGPEKRIASLWERNREMTIKAGDMLAHVWDTAILTQDRGMVACMVCVGAPPRVAATECGGEEGGVCGVSDLHDELIEKHAVEVPVFMFRGKRYLRVSIHVYNDWEDVVALAGAVLKVQGYDDKSDAFARLTKSNYE